MTDQKNTTDPTQDNPAATDPDEGQSGVEDAANLEEKYASLEKQYQELQSLSGRQTNELGELRQYFEGLNELHTVLKENPSLVDAILDGKLTEDLAVAALEDRIAIKDAEAVAEAHAVVKKDLGKKYEKTAPEDIEKLVSEQLGKLRSEIDAKFDEQKAEEEDKEFDRKNDEFMKNTPDFKDHAEAIVKFLDENPKIYDISVAYRAVKGEALENRMKSEVEKARAEAAREAAANAAGGTGHSSDTINDPAIVDKLIASKRRLNV